MATKQSNGQNGANASKINIPIGSVPQIIIWVLSLAAAWYGVQSKLGDIQTSIKVISTQMEGDAKLSERELAGYNNRIRELEITNKAYDIRIRALETENARRGGR